MFNSNKEESVLMNDLIEIVRRTNKTVGHKIASLLSKLAPLNLRRSLQHKIMVTRALHPSFLRSLDIMGVSLGGIVIMDQLVVAKEFQSYLADYTARVSPREAQQFVDFATALLDKPGDEVKNELQSHPSFHPDYAEKANISNFAPGKICDLIFRVCTAKGIIAPRPAKICRARDIFNYLTRRFCNGDVMTDDFITMVRLTLDGFDLSASLAVEHFKNCIPTLAQFIAKDYSLPVPISDDSEMVGDIISFTDRPCNEDHHETASFMNNVTQLYVTQEAMLDLFIEELNKSQCLAILHNEPPYQLPGHDRLDLISIRTFGYVFHLPVEINKRITMAFAHSLRRYENEGGVIYARAPNYIYRYFAVDHDWSPALFDISECLNAAVNKRGNASYEDLAQLLAKANMCWRGRVFSASVTPSHVALFHHAIPLSLIYAFGIRHIGAHAEGGPGGLEERRESERQTSQQQRREEEEQLREADAERRQQEEEAERRQKEEFEEERRRREEEIKSREQQIEQERERDEQRLEEERKEIQRRHEDRRRAVEEERRRLADEEEKNERRLAEEREKKERRLADEQDREERRRLADERRNDERHSSRDETHREREKRHRSSPSRDRHRSQPSRDRQRDSYDAMDDVTPRRGNRDSRKFSKEDPKRRRK